MASEETLSSPAPPPQAAPPPQPQQQAGPPPPPPPPAVEMETYYSPHHFGPQQRPANQPVMQHPVSASPGVWPPAEKQSSGMPLAVKLLVCIPLLLFVVAFVAIAALTALGSTVEERFEPIELADAPNSPVVVGAETTDRPLDVNSNFDEPDLSQVYQGGGGAYSIATAPDWEVSSIDVLGGTEFTYFVDSSLFSGSVPTMVRSWYLGGRDPGFNFEQVVSAQALLSQQEVASISSIVVDGETLWIATMEGGDEIGALGSYMVIHQTETSYAAVVLTAPIELLAQGVVENIDYLQSIRSNG